MIYVSLPRRNVYKPNVFYHNVFENLTIVVEYCTQTAVIL